MPLPKSSADFALPAQQAGSRLSRRSVMALGALGTVAGLAGYAFGVEPRWVSVEHHEMAIPNLPKHLVGKTLVQLSDTHIGNRVDPEYLLRQFDYVSSLQPDFVCFTGDFIDQVDSWHVQEGIRLMERFPRGHSGTVCVLGNHDYVSPSHGRDDSGETNRLIDAFADADGLELLINDSVEMNGLHFAGLPDLWYGGLRRSLSKRVIQKLEGKPSVVLSHNPDTADLPIWGDFDSWVLCGHTLAVNVRFRSSERLCCQWPIVNMCQVLSTLTTNSKCSSIVVSGIQLGYVSWPGPRLRCSHWRIVNSQLLQLKLPKTRLAMYRSKKTL